MAIRGVGQNDYYNTMTAAKSSEGMNGSEKTNDVQDLPKREEMDAHRKELYARSQDSSYKKTSEGKDRKKNQLEEYLEEWMQIKRQQKELLDEKSVKSERQRNRLSKAWTDEWQMEKAASAYEAVMDKLSHTVVQSATSFSDMRAGILQQVREDTGQYGYSDIVNACGLSYARLYSEIEQRHEKETHYQADGAVLTREEEIKWLDMQYEQEVEWQKSCARIAAQREFFQGKIPEVPTKEIEELGDSLYQAKDAYMKLYQENRQSGRTLVMQNYRFGSGSRLPGRFWERG